MRRIKFGRNRKFFNKTVLYILAIQRRYSEHLLELIYLRSTVDHLLFGRDLIPR
jgi:hypothetical protein